MAILVQADSNSNDYPSQLSYAEEQLWDVVKWEIHIMDVQPNKF